VGEVPSSWIGKRKKEEFRINLEAADYQAEDMDQRLTDVVGVWSYFGGGGREETPQSLRLY